ncbi:HypA-like protein, putative [Cordyceps militaris CM01]|uniref:HypA-like protein, putative n=1 Tax=Cordyceps militaris (strain CM01) TaxID=983644 RepID=G3JTK4_CORMM|nr:HypA-like protein, putative [Cordyceps militaris CM01]EGX88008.1 HypA-like protein, putative [Cordyceps militaris CM01]
MSSATRILIGAEETGMLGMKQTPETAAKLSALLQQDMEIVHHLLALYSTGASADVLQRAYDDNQTYQIERKEQGDDAVQALRDNFDEAAEKFFDKDQYYGDFLRFYQGEIEKLGWREAVLKYLLGKEGNFRRLFDSKPPLLYPGSFLLSSFCLLHPYLQLMYGLEWAQPALVALGLAQTSVHKDTYGALFALVDDKARQAALPATPRHLADLYDSMRTEHPHLVAASRWEDGDNSHAGVLQRIPDQIAAYLAANVAVHPDRFDEQVDAVVHAAAYLTAACIFHPPHKPKFDFFIIHYNNLGPALLHLKTQHWIPAAARARLLEWKMRTGILTYLSRGSPRLDLDALRRYVPLDIRTGRANAMVATPEELLPRLHAVRDDGHAVKVARAFLLAQRATRPYLEEGRARPGWVRIADDETWLRAHYALLDSVEGQDVEHRWVRSAGFDAAWDHLAKE